MRRRPLVWMIAVECCLVIAFGVAAWRVVVSHRAASPPGPLASVPDLANPLAPDPQPAAGGSVVPAPSRGPRRPATGPTPGLTQDATFVSRLNTDDAAWEAAQWRLTSAAIAWARRYIDAVVVPAIERAGERGRQTSPGPSPPPPAGPNG
jgi:hypothetical protein